MRVQDMLFAPLYLYQGRRVKRQTLRLQEARGARYGVVTISPSNAVPPNIDHTGIDHTGMNNTGRAHSADHTDDTNTTDARTLRLMLLGDSAAAGVGSAVQDDALMGQLLGTLRVCATIKKRFDTIAWSLQATTGHTAADILRRLYVMPSPPTPIDIVIISVGVNDVTANTAIDAWQNTLTQIIDISTRKFGAQMVIFLSLPPMQHMPALPAPLSGFIGAKAAMLDDALQAVCVQHRLAYHAPLSFTKISGHHPLSALFAKDGFHPSPIAYGDMAWQLADFIRAHLDTIDPKSCSI